MNRLADRRGFTLVELLLAMTMALVAAGSGLAMLGTVGTKQAQNAERADAISKAQVALERMTKEMRQADWLLFQSPQVVDLDVLSRDLNGGAAYRRHVRFDCSANSRCVRYEGPATAYPPPAGSSFSSSQVLLEGVQATHDVFVPQDIDATTGTPVRDYLTPTSVDLSVQITLPRWKQPLRLEDSVMLRNASTFKS